MPRPKKCRKVCSIPRSTQFIPFPSHCPESTIMTMDEYETIRLIDFEGLTQERCAELMEISRTTAQAIYANARKKLAECIVLGRKMTIAGGDIQFCDKIENACRCCCKRCGCSAENPDTKDPV